jgi:hypothetical protein
MDLHEHKFYDTDIETVITYPTRKVIVLELRQDTGSIGLAIEDVKALARHFKLL